MSSPETPANYIRFAVSNPQGIIAEAYRRHFLDFLNKPAAGNPAPAEVYKDFHLAAQREPRLKSTFYSAVRASIDAFRKFGAPSSSSRWQQLMPTMIEQSYSDDALQKHMRAMIEETATHLVIEHGSHNDFELASDILFGAGQSKLYRPLVQSRLVHQIVRWVMASYKEDLVLAAQKLCELRGSEPFAEEIDTLENKRGLHVRRPDFPLHHEPFVVAFNRQSAGLAYYRLDNHGRKHEMSEEDAVKHFGDVIEDVVTDEIENGSLEWVQEIAVDASYSLKLS